MLKEKIKESEKALSQNQCQWRNLVYSKNGDNIIGQGIFNNPEDGDKRMEQILHIQVPNNKANGVDTQITGINGVIPANDYSWHMQIPFLS